MKTCPRCKEQQPFTEFCNDSRNKDGLCTYCKSCKKVDRRERYLSDKQKNNEQVKRWQKQNRHKTAAWLAQYRAKQKNATPVWSEVDKIKRVYEKAKEYGGEVDHIVPIQSKHVCGLHVWSNLQVLPPTMNKVKSNLMWPDMPEVLYD